MAKISVDFTVAMCVEWKGSKSLCLYSGGRKVKAAVLSAYELVPEAYRQKYRKLRKQGNQTYVEFAREKKNLFDRWCSSTGATDFEKLKQLILMTSNPAFLIKWRLI